MKQGNIIFVTLLMTILVGIVDPLRATFTDHELNDDYGTVLGMCFILIAILALYVVYTVKSRRKAQQHIQSLDKEDLSPLSSKEYHYQEPMQQFDQHPVRIVDHADNTTAVFEVRYKNIYEKWMTMLGVFDYSNIELQTHHTIVYFEQLPLREAFKRPKWNVFMNKEYRGFLEMAPLSKAGIKNQIVFYYYVDEHRYTIHSPHINPNTYIQDDHDQTLMQGERTILEVGKKGNDGSRGKKHHVTNTDTSDLSTAEKLGLYQQIMMKIDQS